MNMYAYHITQTDVQFKIRKINVNTGAIIGESPVDNSTAVYGVYSDKNCTDKVAEIKIGANGIGMTMLPLKLYYVKEIKAPTGYALDETVYTLTNGDTMDLPERFIAPEVITHFAKRKLLYEDKKHHNAVFVGVDGNGVPRQAHKRSTTTFGNSFRQTIEGSDTRYSFAHFGKSNMLFVFEAPHRYVKLYFHEPE